MDALEAGLLRHPLTLLRGLGELAPDSPHLRGGVHYRWLCGCSTAHAARPGLVRWQVCEGHAGVAHLLDGPPSSSTVPEEFMAAHRALAHALPRAHPSMGSE